MLYPYFSWMSGTTLIWYSRPALQKLWNQA